jgi:signal transduction histidine kinase
MRSMQVSIASVTLPLESKIAWIKEIAGNLPESARGKTTFDHSDISEIDDLGISIGSLTEQITGLEDHLSKVNFDRGRLKMAEHVAHNIKGVIATLQLKVNALPASSEKDRRDLMDCVQSLRDVSAGLLKSKKKERSGEHVEEPAAPIHLLEVVRAAVATKATQYSENGQVDISIESEASAYGLFAAVPAAELKAILSNLIDNSVDAANGLCRIQITLQSVSGQVAISVRDNGRGIPEHILPLLMAEGFSYGKENGNGIGLFHAKEVIEKSQGKIEIHSQEGFGTKINMTLPKAKAPAGFLRSIEIPIGGTVICVDDDSIIHDVLDSKLRQVRNEISQVVHLYSARAFNDWIAANGAGTFGSRIYLFDYDLKDDEGTGLDLIHSHGLAFESVLVSGMVTDRLVAERAAKIGVKCLSKDFLDVVPIVMDAATQPEVRVSEVACLV